MIFKTNTSKYENCETIVNQTQLHTQQMSIVTQFVLKADILLKFFYIYQIWHKLNLKNTIKNLSYYLTQNDRME